MRAKAGGYLDAMVDRYQELVVLAAIALMNVAIWTVPDAGGSAPLDKLEQGTR